MFNKMKKFLCFFTQLLLLVLCFFTENHDASLAFPFWPILAGAALMGGKTALVDKPAAKARNRAAAMQTRYSPWTGLGMGQLERSPSIFGSAIAGGVQGGLMGHKYGAEPLRFGTKKTLSASSLADPFTRAYT